MKYSLLQETTYILYIIGSDTDSYDVASYYSNKHNIPIVSSENVYEGNTIAGIYWRIEGQGIGIQIEQDDEILENEEIFNKNILDPLLEVFELINYEREGVNCLVLSYGIPIGFYSGESEGRKIVSTTSRLSCYGLEEIGDSYGNPLFNVTEENYSLNNSFCICSSLNSFSVEDSYQLIDSGYNNFKISKCNGTFYIDPYTADYPFDENSKNDYIDSFSYATEVLLPFLNINFKLSENRGIFENSLFKYLLNDSLYWGWNYRGINNYLFQNSYFPRFLFLNIDNKGLRTIKEDTESFWLKKVVENNYGFVVGFMDEENADVFPIFSFFLNYINKGYSVGEALFLSSPYFATSLSFYGDPLVFMEFSVVEEEDSIEDFWDEMIKKIAEIVAYGYSRRNKIFNILTNTINTNDVSLETSLLQAQNDFYRQEENLQYLLPLINNILSFPIWEYYNIKEINAEENLSFYLEKTGKRIPRLLTEVSGYNLNEKYLLDEGWWKIDFKIEDVSGEYVNYFYELRIFNDEELNINAIENDYVIDSGDDTLNWKYFKDNDYKSFPISGVSSAYLGNNVRYIAKENEYLERGKFYFFQYKPYIKTSEGKEYYEDKVIKQIIYG